MKIIKITDTINESNIIIRLYIKNNKTNIIQKYELCSDSFKNIDILYHNSITKDDILIQRNVNIFNDLYLSLYNLFNSKNNMI